MANLFDKAANIAMEKVNPSPKISIMIAMEGGGGLSDVRKTMNIGGQPHKLAYITPDEGSLLKQLGGSGRRVNGIPAYDFTDLGDAEIGEDLAAAGHDPGYSPEEDPGGDEPPGVGLGGMMGPPDKNQLGGGQTSQGLTSISGKSGSDTAANIFDFVMSAMVPMYGPINALTKATTGKGFGQRSFGKSGEYTWGSVEKVGPDGRPTSNQGGGGSGAQGEGDDGTEEEEEVPVEEEEQKRMTKIERYLRNMIDRQEEGGDPLYNEYERKILERIYNQPFTGRQRVKTLEDYGLEELDDDDTSDDDGSTDTGSRIESAVEVPFELPTTFMPEEDDTLSENELRILRQIYGENFDREVA
jgi:hypothetical protein|tara:strand:+ start:2853 stop:3920 length:1068 start_codon:yes stop_codon:yes gene_type:complete